MKIGINGFGRIGRRILRLALDQGLDVVAVNSRSSVEEAGHLFKYDSIHGIYPQKVCAEKDFILVAEKKIHYSACSHPSKIPWDKWDVDLVLECSGVFKKRQDLDAHLRNKVKWVYVAAPVSTADLTVIYGINHQDFNLKKHQLISNGSCTTNCIAPLVWALDRCFEVEEMMFTTVHAYTQDQRLLDASHKTDLRRSRAGALSMIPTSTGASRTLEQIFPQLKNKIKGLAVRVPTPNVSLVDVVFKMQSEFNLSDIQNCFLDSAKRDLKGILACEEKPLVSVDFNGSSYSVVVDFPSLMLIEKGLVKILAWYDNETGFSQRMIDFIKTAF